MKVNYKVEREFCRNQSEALHKDFLHLCGFSIFFNKGDYQVLETFFKD